MRDSAGSKGLSLDDATLVMKLMAHLSWNMGTILALAWD